MMRRRAEESSRAERDRRVHTGMFGAGSGHGISRTADDAGAGGDRRGTGSAEAIRSDNGPEFTSRHFLAWALEKKIEVVHIEPGKPVQNAHVESFHGKLRDECLNASWFGNLWEARAKIAAWKKKYNEERPHSSLGYFTPAGFARRIAALRPPTADSAPQLGNGRKPKS